ISDTDTGIFHPDTNQRGFSAGGIEGLRITGGGPGQPTVDAYGDLQVQGGSRLLLPAEGNTANPTLAFRDGDTGINESTDDTLEFAIGGAARFNMNASFLFAQQTDGAGIRSSSAS